MPQNERYWYYAKKSLVKQFNVRVERRSDNKDFFDVVGIDKSEEIELNRSKLNLTLQLANLTASTWSSLKSPPIAGNFIVVLMITKLLVNIYFLPSKLYGSSKSRFLAKNQL